MTLHILKRDGRPWGNFEKNVQDKSKSSNLYPWGKFLISNGQMCKINLKSICCDIKLGRITNRQNCSFHLDSGPRQQHGQPMQDINKCDRLG